MFNYFALIDYDYIACAGHQQVVILRNHFLCKTELQWNIMKTKDWADFPGEVWRMDYQSFIINTFLLCENFYHEIFKLCDYMYLDITSIVMKCIKIFCICYMWIVHRVWRYVRFIKLQNEEAVRIIVNLFLFSWVPINLYCVWSCLIIVTKLSISIQSSILFHWFMDNWANVRF